MPRDKHQSVEADPPIVKSRQYAPGQSPLEKARAAMAAKRAAAKLNASAERQAIDDVQEVVERATPVTRAGIQPQTRSPARAPVRRAPHREVEREPERRGAMVVTGRNGEALTRRRTTVGDIFHVPPDEIPAGWDYQWNTVSVAGNAEVARDHQVIMHANGFRPVPADRHPGRWTASGEKGAIIVNGLRLEERPTTLGNEARSEDHAKARTQMRDQTDSLRLTEKLPTGFEAKRKYRGTGGDLRISIDPALDIPRPTQELADD